MKKIGIVALLFVGLGILGAGCGSSTAASTNECTALANAYASAAKGTGCSMFFSAAASALMAEEANCPAAAVDSTYVACYTGCLGKLTDCTSATATAAYATCAGGCKP